MLRLLAVLAVVGALFAAAFASAAALGVQGGVVQAGSDDSLICQPVDQPVQVVGFGVELNEPELSSGFVQITNVHPDCGGAEVAALVKDELGNEVGTYNGFLPGIVASDANYNIDLLPAGSTVPLADIYKVNVVITRSGELD